MGVGGGGGVKSSIGCGRRYVSADSNAGSGDLLNLSISMRVSALFQGLLR